MSGVNKNCDGEIKVNKGRKGNLLRKGVVLLKDLLMVLGVYVMMT